MRNRIGNKKHSEEYKRKQQTVHRIYNQALYNKKLIPAKICENCLRTDNNIHGHHFDYDKPLDVVWLCATCHIKVHCESKFIGEKNWPDSFKERTSQELSAKAKETLYRKLGIDKYRHIPLKERCTQEEKTQLEEYKKLFDQFMLEHFRAKDNAYFYFEKMQMLEKELTEKYPKDVEQLY